MSALSIQPPYPAFAGTDGLPLENGYIWIGTVNLNPQVNPIAVYWDAALTIPAAQPIRTLNGYPMYQGTPARFYAASDYSILVQNSKGSLVYSSLSGNLSGNNTIASNATGDGIEIIFPVSSAPNAIYINGVYQNKNTYTIAGGNVTFSEAPPITSVIEFLI
tara:strand:- start:2921 stop:3406 length:486 start_codon:yes stop_codon:yes gene_type:complete